MLTEQQKAFGVLHFEKYTSVITMQHDFQQKFNIKPLTAQNIKNGHITFQETGWSI